MPEPRPSSQEAKTNTVSKAPGSRNGSQNSQNPGFDHIVAHYNHPVLFYALAAIFPWAFWFAAAYLSNLHDQTPTVRATTTLLSVAGLISPVAVAAALIWRRPQLRADVVHRLSWPQNSNWLLIACAFLLVPASVYAATAVSVLFGYSTEQFQLRGGYTFSAGLLPVWVTLLGAAVLEELAWHSYGTDTLIRRMRIFSASMVFTAFWVLWHLPLSFINGYYHNEVVKSGWLHTLNFPLSVVAFVLLMNWLYFRTGRSILVPVIFHASANFANEIFRTDPDTKIFQTGLLLIVSVAVVLLDRTLFFQRPSKITIRT